MQIDPQYSCDIGSSIRAGGKKKKVDQFKKNSVIGAAKGIDKFGTKLIGLELNKIISLELNEKELSI